MNADVEHAISQYGKLINMPLTLSEGACVITTQNNIEIWIEIIEGGECIVIHAELIKDFSARGEGSSALEYLKCNGNTSLLKGAWLCVNESSDTLRLCVTVNNFKIDATLIDSRVKLILDLLTELDFNKLVNGV